MAILDVKPTSEVVPNDITITQKNYDFSYRTFPDDIGGAGSPHQHYMVININVRDKTAVSEGTSYADHITFDGHRINTFQTTNELSTMDVLRYKIDPRYKSASGKGLGIFDNTVSLSRWPRYTRRIVESIAIFTPHTLLFTNTHEYEDLSIVGRGGDLIGGGFMGGVLNSTLGVLGRQINPQTEILFRTTPQRQFIFDFLMAPANAKETTAMDQIYRVLKFHAAPEFSLAIGKSGIGFIDDVTDKANFPLFKTPSEFDIAFYYKGNENTYLPKINTCVLERIDMDYAPTGAFSTFRNGAPVSARMALVFRELEIVSKLRVVQGY